MIDERSLSILNDIVYSKERNVESIQEKYNLTFRQVAYSIQKINESILLGTPHELVVKEETILLSREGQAYLEAQLALSEETVYFSKAHRQAILFFLLIQENDYLSLQHLMSAVQASKSTVLNDLADLKGNLLQWALAVNYQRDSGYHVVGEELAIRQKTLSLVLERLNQEPGRQLLHAFIMDVLPSTYEQVELAFQQSLAKSPVQLSQSQQEEVIYGLTLLHERLHRPVDWPQRISGMKVDATSIEYALAQTVTAALHLDQALVTDYLYYWLLSLSRGDRHLETTDADLIRKWVQQLVSRFESLSATQLGDQSLALDSLYQHLRPAYYRIALGFPVFNPLTQAVEEAYPRLFHLVERVVATMSQELDFPIVKAELAYLTIHFATLMMAKREPLATRLRGVIICPNGIGTATLLKRELEKLYPDVCFSIANYWTELDTSAVDFIVSTLVTDAIRQHQTPYLLIEPLIHASNRDKIRAQLDTLIESSRPISFSLKDVMEIVRQEVSLDQYQRIEQAVYHPHHPTDPASSSSDSEGELPLLSQIISEDLVQLNLHVKDWEEAIRQATRVLVEQGKALPTYIEDMIQITREIGPYIVITKHVALPHARPEAGAKALAICIATLATPVEFGNPTNDPVKYIFGLSALDSHTHLAAMAELAELLDQPEFYQVLSQARQASDIIHYIQDYEEGRE